jgi:hypothetical protein
MTTNHTVQIVQRLEMDTLDLCISIDIYVLKVQYGKRIGYMSAWCEAGQDVKALLDLERKERLRRTIEYYTRIKRMDLFKEDSYEKFDHYFPASTTELKAKKHFELMVEMAPLTQFINQ